MTLPERHEDRVAQASQSPAAVSRLAASWRRSMVKHGLDPARPPQLRRLSARELAERRERLDGFIAVARPQLDHLFQLVCPTGCNVLLTDASGIVLEQRMNESDLATFRDWGLCAGADWSEPAEGTNGIGTCLAEGRQVTIHRDEHFYARNTGLSCMDAPIWGPDGRLLAALDVSSARADQTERYNRLIGAQVAQTARAIEAVFFRASFPEARIIVASEDNCDATVLLAVDKDDIVIGASRGARHVLGLTPADIARGVVASDLIDMQCDTPGVAECGVLRRALVRNRGNVTAAARELSISLATMKRKIRQHGLDRQRLT